MHLNFIKKKKQLSENDHIIIRDGWSIQFQIKQILAAI